MIACPDCGAENPAGSRFCNACGAALSEPAVPVGEVRKTVTVSFCDVTGSTALGEKLDPELRGTAPSPLGWGDKSVAVSNWMCKDGSGHIDLGRFRHV